MWRVGLCWLVINLLYLSINYITLRQRFGRGLDTAVVAVETIYCFCGFVGTAIAFTRRGRQLWRVNALWLAIIVIVCSVAMAGLRTWLTVVFGTFRVIGFAYEFHPALIDVTFTMGVVYGMQVLEAMRQRLLSEREAEKELAWARLRLLRAQLQPHFLFNALNGISGHVTSDPPEAQRMIAKLGTLLRMSLGTSEAQMTTVEEEIEFTEAYLDLQRRRFGGRLEVTVVVDANALALEMPSFLLQPLVENSVRHVVEATDGPVEIGVQVRRLPGLLHITIWDSSATPRPQTKRGSGLGVANTSARLFHLYGGRAVFDVAHHGGGTMNTIEIPVQ